jgi:hypothetical protein
MMCFSLGNAVPSESAVLRWVHVGVKRRRRSAFFKQIFLSLLLLLLGNGNAKWLYSFAAPTAALPRECCCMRRLLSLLFNEHCTHSRVNNN